MNQVIVLPWNSSQLLHLRDFIKDNRTQILPCRNSLEVPIGVLAYEDVLSAMILYPNFEGYLFAHDDMAMNISTLMDFDLNSAWFIKNDGKEIDTTWKIRKNGMNIIYRLNKLVTSWEVKIKDWPWWNTIYGTTAIDNVISSEENIARALRKCVGSEHKWFIGQADFFYIPKGLKNLFLSIMSKFGRHKVFLEIGIPTFAKCFVPSHLNVNVELCTFFDDRRGDYAAMRMSCGDRYPLFHPLKPSNKTSFNGMKSKMNLTQVFNSRIKSTHTIIREKMS